MPTVEQSKRKAKAKIKLEKMEVFLLRQLEKQPDQAFTFMEQDAQELIKNDRAALLKEMNRKLTLIRLMNIFIFFASSFTFTIR